MTFHPPPHPPHPQEPVNYHTYQQHQSEGQWPGIYPPSLPPSMSDENFQGQLLKEELINTPEASFEGDDVHVDPLLREDRSSRRRRTIAQTIATITAGSSTGRKVAKSKGKGKPTSISGPSVEAVPSQVDTHTPAPAVHPPDISEHVTAIFLPDPYQPPIQLKGMNKSGLLPAPPGSILDVNDLLILHPPARETHGLGHTSQYEMYTCRVCSKTYDGKNARSVARRHLQDKHGVPLAVQKRRSRWDYEPDRPRTKKDAKERSLKSKRDWANKNRQIQRLEKAQAPFLERFGPEGIITPCGMRLIAPRFRGPVANVPKSGSYLDGVGGNLIIPENILREVQAIRDLDAGFHGQSHDDENMEEEDRVTEEGAVALTGKAKGKGKKRTQHRQARNKVFSRTTSQEDASTRSNTPLNTISDETPSPATFHSHLQNFTAAIGAPRHGMYFQPYIPQVYGWQTDSSFQSAMSQAAGTVQYPFAHANVQGPVFQDQHLPHQHFQQHYQQPQYQQVGELLEEEADKDGEGEEEQYNEETPIDHTFQDDQESSLLPSSPEDIGPLPEQQWVPSQTWESVREEESQAALEPALDISKRWQGLMLTGTGWGSSDDDEMDASTGGEHNKCKEGSVGAEGEAAAAESLLNLHSTPLRGPEEAGRNEIQLARAQADFNASSGSRSDSKLGLRFGAELASSSSSSATSDGTLIKDNDTGDENQDNSRSASTSVLTKGWSDKLLAAPPIISPTRATTLARSGRAHSFIQPFRDPRPEVTRSLSFDHQPTLGGDLDDDDPFILPDTPSHTLTSSSAMSSSAARGRSSSSAHVERTPASAMRRSKRHTISLPSPSPFASSRHFSLSSSSVSSASVLKKRKDAPTSPFANPTPSAKHVTSSSNQPQMRSALRPISTNVKPNYSGAFATPIKSTAFGSTSTHTLPQSLTREWLQLSSPCNADAAASLGLVPTHLAPATPGLRGVIGAETPEMTILEARAKKRRGEATPGTGAGIQALGIGYGRR
ncbi:hypothetical protein IAU59_003874 [Kwoniella sp. CBS 9459]